MAEFRSLKNYNSNTESSEAELPPPSKKARTIVEWEQIETFENLEAAKDHVKKLQFYKYHSAKTTARGRRLLYICKTKNCLSKLYIMINGNNFQTFKNLYVTF